MLIGSVGLVSIANQVDREGYQAAHAISKRSQRDKSFKFWRRNEDRFLKISASEPAGNSGWTSGYC